MSIRYSDDRPTLVTGGKAWTLRLVCCGRAAGFESADTWQEADAFRRAYCESEGHERAAIIEATQGGPR
jgi:hypothetical protein